MIKQLRRLLLVDLRVEVFASRPDSKYELRGLNAKTMLIDGAFYSAANFGMDQIGLGNVTPGF